MTNSEIRPLNREFIAERDLRIYQMRAAGITHTHIAKTMGMTVRAVSQAITRQTTRLNREAAISYPEVMRLELERLDKLHSALWPLTQHRKITLDDGTIIAVEPDIKAVDTVLKIQASRTKLLGIDTQKIDIAVDIAGEIRHTLHGSQNEVYSEIDKRSETLDMIKIMSASRIIDQKTADALLANIEDDIEDAEVIEEGTNHE